MRHPFPVAPAGSSFRAALGVCLILALLSLPAVHRLGSAQGGGSVSKTAYPRCLVHAFQVLRLRGLCRLRQSLPGQPSRAVGPAVCL